MRKLVLVLIALLAIVTFVRTADQSLEANERAASAPDMFQTVHLNDSVSEMPQQLGKTEK
ncbi:MAG: hypothetical protein Ta2B_26620 [Termitinemataceae bacterium]|nr:MAG: hypothetical protein Ta2B_26620 [Termitinemataceae bacterium]